MLKWTSYLDDEDEDEDDKGRLPDMPLSAGPVPLGASSMLQGCMPWGCRSCGGVSRVSSMVPRTTRAM